MDEIIYLIREFALFDQMIKFLDVIIWPCVVLVVLFTLRKPLIGMLPLVHSIKYKEVEVRFRENLERIKRETHKAGNEPVIEEETIVEIKRLIDVSPSSAILASWKKLEIIARQKVEELAPKDTGFVDILRRPIEYLEHTGALIPSTAGAVRELQSLRNQVAHTAEVVISRETALEYSLVVQAIGKQIEAIYELPKIKLTALTILILELNHLIDSGKYNHISIADVHKAIDQKRIIPFLSETTKGDFSLYRTDGPYVKFVESYHEMMYQIYGGYAGNERRKWGVENLGLCLLLAWTNEIIQQGAGWHPGE